jgi:hypothetical protein
MLPNTLMMFSYVELPAPVDTDASFLFAAQPTRQPRFRSSAHSGARGEEDAIKRVLRRGRHRALIAPRNGVSND